MFSNCHCKSVIVPSGEKLLTYVCDCIGLFTGLMAIMSSSVRTSEITDFFPEAKNNLTKISWAHAVNNQSLLDDALRGKYSTCAMNITFNVFLIYLFMPIILVLFTLKVHKMLGLSAKKKWLPLNVIKALSQKFVRVHGRNSHALLDVVLNVLSSNCSLISE